MVTFNHPFKWVENSFQNGIRSPLVRNEQKSLVRLF